MIEGKLKGLFIYDCMSTQEITTEYTDLQTAFKEFIGYCTYTRKLRPATIRGYEAAFILLRNLVPETKSCADLTKKHMNKFFSSLETRVRIVGKGEERVGIKTSTTMTYWSKLNVFFVWLLDNDYIEDNPLKNMRPAEPQYDDKRELKRHEIEKIIGAIDRCSKNSLTLKRDKALIYLLLFSGLRKGEIIGLKVMDIDLHNNLLRVDSKTSKSRKERKIPINKVLRLHIEEYIKERNEHKYKTEYFVVSTNKDSGLTVHGYKHLVNRLRKLSGINFHLHQFRHSFACNLVRADVGISKIQKLMGHLDLRMTQRYVRSIDVEDMRDDVDKLSIENMM
jgi:site-specific recombinase XerD